MKKFLLFLFFLPQVAFSQAMLREYSMNDTVTRPKAFQSLCQLTNGDLLATADIYDTVPYPNFNSRVAMVRMDASGNVIWSKFLPQTHNYSRDLDADSTGCYMLNGRSFCSLVHCDTSITPTWMRHLSPGISGFMAYGMACHSALGKGCFVNGYYFSALANDDMLWATKLDTAGNVIFSKAYAWAGYDLGNSFTGMETTNDGGAVFPFYAQRNDSLNNHFYASGLMKLDSMGNIVWVHSYPDTISRVPTTIKMLPDSGFIIAGYVNAVAWQPAPYVFFMRTDKFGNQIWCNYYDQLCQLYVPLNYQGLTLMNNGHLLLGFSYVQTSGYCNAGELLECDVNGQFINAVRVGGIFSDSIGITQVIQSGGKIVATGARITNVSPTSTNLPIFHPCTIVFDSLNNTFCNKDVPVVLTYSTPLPTNTPTFTTAAGPIVSNMTLLTLQPFQMATNVCVPNGIENPSSDNANVSVFPNPSKGNMTVDVHVPSANNCQFLLYDFTGRLLEKSSIQNNSTFQLERKNRANGIYFIQIVADGKQVYAGKIVFAD